ncbi:MAG TPA: LuxR C-terminal-related transcriptional regulator, partial [Acidimicrobiales bacterium]|nr:LuxR C-terminal-related transcriptional regulator [Acidimicrobiales bacterium]
AEAVAREGMHAHRGSHLHLRLLHRLETACWLQGRGDEELEAMEDVVAGLAVTDRRLAVLELAEQRVSAHARREHEAEAHAALADLIARTGDASDADTRVLHVTALASAALMGDRPADAESLLAEARRIAEEHDLLPRLRRIELQELDIALWTGPVALVRRLGDRVRRNGSASVPWRNQIVDHVCGLAALEPGWGVGVERRSDTELAWPLRQPVTMAHRAWVTGDADLAAEAADLAREIGMATQQRRGVAYADPWVVSGAQLVLTGDRGGAAELVAEIERRVDVRFTWAPAAELVCAVAELAGADELLRATCAVLRAADRGLGWSTAIASLCAASVTDVEDRADRLLGAADLLDAVCDRHRLAVALTGALEAGADPTAAERLEPLLDPVERCGLSALAQRMRAVLGSSAPPESRPAALTRRQFEIAELVAEGLSNAAVADRLCISVRTVTSHLDHIYARLGVRNRTELAVRLPEWR